MTTIDDQPDTDGSDPFAAVRENKNAVETLTDRDDRIGAAARIVLALAHGDQPDASDLDAVGIPVGPVGEFTNTEGSQ